MAGKSCVFGKSSFDITSHLGNSFCFKAHPVRFFRSFKFAVSSDHGNLFCPVFRCQRLAILRRQNFGWGSFCSRQHVTKRKTAVVAKLLGIDAIVSHTSGGNASIMDRPGVRPEVLGEPPEIFGNYKDAVDALGFLEEALSSLGQVTHDLESEVVKQQVSITEHHRQQLELDLAASPSELAYDVNGRSLGSTHHTEASTSGVFEERKSFSKKSSTKEVVRGKSAVQTRTGKGLRATARSATSVHGAGVGAVARCSFARHSRTATWGKTAVQITLEKKVRTSAFKNGDDAVAVLLKTYSKGPLLTAEEEKDLASAVQKLVAIRGTEASLKDSLGRDPTAGELAKAAKLSKKALQKRVDEGESARDRMMKANLRLVASIAKKYLGSGMDMEDLMTEGIMGLERSVDKFDPSKGFKFSTYSYWWIRQAIVQALSDKSRVVRVPSHLYDIMKKLRKAESQLADVLHREPSRSEVAMAVGLPLKKVNHVYRAYAVPKSLEAPVSRDGEGATVADFIEDESQACPEEVAIKNALSADLNTLLLTLSEREYGILRMRYGLDGSGVHTLEEIGQRFEVSRERIRQVWSKAMRKLRHPSRSAVLMEYVDNMGAPLRPLGRGPGIQRSG